MSAPAAASPSGDPDRRTFIHGSLAAAAAGAALAGSGIAGAATPVAAGPALDLAEWSYFWLGVKRARIARGTVVTGEQMYVESWIPAEVRQPVSVVMVHGGGSQGLDWMGTPDGRPGWVTHFLKQGYPVYVVDRPGHGRAPYYPEMHGPFGPRFTTYEQVERQLVAPERHGPDSAPAGRPYGLGAQRHTQWPGSTGTVGDLTLDHMASSQGGAFLGDLATTHAVWAERGGELLDKIGPSVIVAHSAGAATCWLFANARPALVKAIVAVEPVGPAFAGALSWGLTAAPVAYDPPAVRADALRSVEVQPTEAGRYAYRVQAEPARKLKNLQGIPIAVVTANGSYHWPYDLGSVAFLRQAGCDVEHIELDKLGIHGNGHMLMLERNNAETVQPVLQWLQRSIPAALGRRPAREAVRVAGSGGRMHLADQGYFWIAGDRKQTPYGLIPAGPMFVQYLIPREVRHQLPIVLVHGGGGQMLQYLGPGDGQAGWTHYLVQAGYKVYLVDRPGHGRGVYHPDALGPMGPQPIFEQYAAEMGRAAPDVRYGSGQIGDPALDQFVATLNAPMADAELARRMWRARGAALLDRIGPAVIFTHSAGGSFGWVVADERPQLTRALVSFEGAGAPLVEAGAPARTLLNLRGIPMLYLTSPNGGRTQGPAIVAALQGSGAVAEHMALSDRGLHGNGHFAMLEKNRKDVLDVILAWISVKAPS